MRLVIFTAVFGLLLAGVGAAGPIVVPPEPEGLVEGHTVFTVIDAVRPTNGTTREENVAAAVAVLVREYVYGKETSRFSRFPGVLWFNDQYLLEPSSGRNVQRDRDSYRYPCTGAVIAVNQGDPVPHDAEGVAHVGNSTYVESYLITDVHDHSWNVDRWTTWNGRPLWSVALLDLQAGYGIPDDGSCSGGTFVDTPCDGRLSVPGYGCVRFGPGMSLRGLPSTYARNPGDHGYDYPCGTRQDACEPIEYNAVLYFRLSDLDIGGVPKNHTDGSADWENDVAGCHETNVSVLDDWPCPDGDDHREGNSHPYNPDMPWPVQRYAGRGNHGGSANCGGPDAANDSDCHATRLIDVYYGYGQIPLQRNYWLIDVVGRGSPYHCHDDMALCGPEDLST